MMRYLILLFLGIALASCTTDDPNTIAQNEIRDVMYDISLDFNLGNIYGILDKVDDEYLHKGMIFWHLNQMWLDRLARFQLLEIEVLYIEIQNDLAVVHSKNTFTSSIETVVYNEPNDNGDISYFIRRNGQWLIYGNQAWIRK